MKRNLSGTWLIVLVGVLMLAFSTADAGDFSGCLTATTDYVFRGVSQTLEEPAVQGGIEYAADIGFYGGIWGSNVNFTNDAPDDGASLEFDVYVGWGGQFSDDWAWDVNLSRYTYLGTVEGVEYDYNELGIGVTFKEMLTASIGYSNDVFASDETGIYYNLAAEIPLGRGFSVASAVGYYDLDDLCGMGYTDWKIGVAKEWKNLVFDLSYFDTDNNGQEIFGDLAGDRIVFGVTISL